MYISVTLSNFLRINVGVIFIPPSHTSLGLKVDAEVKRGKTIHVPDSVYKKGCVRDAKHGVTVSQCMDMPAWLDGYSITRRNNVIIKF